MVVMSEEKMRGLIWRDKHKSAKWVPSDIAKGFPGKSTTEILKELDAWLSAERAKGG